MKPYYEEDGITIYHGDCRDIVPALQVDGLDVSLLLTDPPYGIDFNQSGRHGRFSGQGVTTMARARGNWPIYGDDEPFDPIPWACFSNSILWGSDHFYKRLPITGRWLAWNKLGDLEPWDSFCDVEFAWHSKPGAARIFNMKWKGIACEKEGENNGLREHPTQKPLRLMRWCIKESRSTEGLILDPFMGSGTTLRAAKDLGRRAIGIEIEEKYCEIAAKRLAQKVLQF